ncbi:MAG TPA: YceI family protein [Bryobacteraceae bacterium]|jgi:polyisoprenoid-binding protein YceI|nr:YceI family protein [Bryobacteraceae bacterium]
MRTIVLAFATASLAFSHPVQVSLDLHVTKVNFSVGDVLHTVHGTFQLTKGNLWFDPTSGKAGGELVVNGASGDSGSHARDSRMTKNILQAAIYPEIEFVPDRIDGAVTLAGHSEFKLHGLLTIHGAAHEVTMKVKSDIDGNSLKANAAFDVPYVRWGMKNPSTLLLRVNDTVPIEVQAVGQLGDRA